MSRCKILIRYIKFIPLEGVGHCPQDEAPELVNPILWDWIGKQST
jgi:pimeloyl-ACP methyl ester carboxylesterase